MMAILLQTRRRADGVLLMDRGQRIYRVATTVQPFLAVVFLYVQAGVCPMWSVSKWTVQLPLTVLD